jgi:DNA invertase Pin-like site-specific DNA recombinase
MVAYGYIRQSRSDDESPGQSPMVQEDRIRALAVAKGDADIVIAQHDLNVSGGRSAEDRPGFRQIVEAIRDGECTAIYAFDLSRLFRNLREQIDFFEMVKDRGIPVRFVEGDVGEVAGATGDLMREVLGAMNQWQRKITSEKIKASLARKQREEGYRHGARPYGERDGEDASAVVAAFREAGSFDGAARFLNARGTACRTRRGIWHGSTVREIVRRQLPDDVMTTRRGAPTMHRTFRFGGLMTCSTCGTTMTGSRDSRTGEVRYYCHRAKVVPHGRGWVSEKIVLPVIEAESDRAIVGFRRAQVGRPEDEARARALDEKRERIVDMAADGVIDKADRDRRLAEVDAEKSKLSVRRWVKRVAVPPDVREGDPGAVSDHLRHLFSRVEVDTRTPARRGPQTSPIGVEFAWIDPTLRAGDEAMADAE